MSFLILFYEFFIIGLFTFGGGYAMIPLVQDVVIKHSWLTESEFLNMIGISESTPGPIAINMATYVGSIVGKTELGDPGTILGSVIATFAVVLPSFLVMLLIALLLKRFMKNRFAQGALKGIAPVAVALIASSGLILLSDILFPLSISGENISFNFNFEYVFCFFIVVLNILLCRKVFNNKLNPIFVILISAVIGISLGYIFNFAI